MDTAFTKKIKAVLVEMFPANHPSELDVVAERIFDITGRLDYRLKYDELIHRNMACDYFSKYSGAMSVVARQRKTMRETIDVLIDEDTDAAIKKLRGWVRKNS